MAGMIATDPSLSPSALDEPSLLSEPSWPSLKASDPDKVPVSCPLEESPHRPRDSFMSRRILLRSIYRYCSATDKSLLRLRRLLATTSGLDTFLATVNAILDVSAHFTAAHSSSSYPVFWRFVSRITGPGFWSSRALKSPRSDPLIDPPLAVSLENLASLVSQTRTTLRLTALLPLYSSLRQLLRSNRQRDRYLRAILLTQCLFYIVFQAAENMAFLIDRRILSRRWLGKGSATTKLWMLSSRAWLVGVSCDFLVLFRKALIEKERRSRTKESPHEMSAEAEDELDRQWWRSLFVASCYLPMCLHYSLQAGLVGVNKGVLGTLGFMAGAQTFTNQWAEIESTL